MGKIWPETKQQEKQLRKQNNGKWDCYYYYYLCMFACPCPYPTVFYTRAKLFHFRSAYFHLYGLFRCLVFYPFQCQVLFLLAFFLELLLLLCIALLFAGHAKRWTLRRTLFLHHHLDCSFRFFFALRHERVDCNRRKLSTHKNNNSLTSGTISQFRVRKNSRQWKFGRMMKNKKKEGK